jgi:hypothetical protein
MIEKALHDRKMENLPIAIMICAKNTAYACRHGAIPPSIPSKVPASPLHTRVLSRDDLQQVNDSPVE